MRRIYIAGVGMTAFGRAPDKSVHQLAIEAIGLAVQALEAGTCDIALAVGSEKMNVPDRAG